MSILIEGMEMPKAEFGSMIVAIRPDGMVEDVMGCYVGKVVPVPPHGRLIDADKITEHKYTTIPPYRKKYADEKPKSDEEIIAFMFGWNYAIDGIVENAPTIIPESDEDINVLCKEEGE